MTSPPTSLVVLVHNIIADLLTHNPAASCSEAYIQNYVEFEIIEAEVEPKYYTRIGINYHGHKVQQLKIDPTTGFLIGWNPTGDALGIAKKAKMLLAGYTIFDRDAEEPMMNDAKIGGGEIPEGSYIRLEFKARGWLGKTKNLDGKQLEKDLDLLKEDKADLLVICLSETAHRKWRGEGPTHQVSRRSGLTRFSQILIDTALLQGTNRFERTITFESQRWVISTQRVIGATNSIMPGAEHYITLCYRSAN